MTAAGPGQDAVWWSMTCKCEPAHDTASHSIHDTMTAIIEVWLKTLPLGDLLSSGSPWEPNWPVAARMGEWVDSLAADRNALAAMARCPHALQDSIGHTFTAALAKLVNRQDAREATVWALSTVLVEAGWAVILRDSPEAERHAEDAPLLARTRFDLLSAPQRLRAAASPGALIAPLDDPTKLQAVEQDAIEEYVLGGRATYLIALRSARASWVSILAQYQSYPVLRLSADGLEHETDRVVLATPNKLLPTGGSDMRQLEWSPPDASTLSQILELHVLPRFRVNTAWHLDRLCHQAQPGRMRAIWARVPKYLPIALTLLSMLSPFVALIWVGSHERLRWVAIALAATAILVAGIDSLQPRAAAAMKWLWRLPAAGVVGVLVLLTLSGTWWSSLRVQPLSTLIIAGAALLIASYAYLVMEVVGHRVSAGRAIKRSAVVFGAAVAHSYAVAVIGLNTLGPVFMDMAVTGTGSTGDPMTLATVLRDPTHYAWFIWLSTAWCVAVGTFSQVLWDDRPTTAPLAHMRWMKGN